MQAAQTNWLNRLQHSVQRADRDEREFRDTYYEKLARLERLRVLANRRADLFGKIARAVESAPEESDVHAIVTRVLQEEIGLQPSNEGHQIIIERFHPVTDAIAATFVNDAVADDDAVMDAINAFEAWYRERTGQDFMGLFDVYVAETPRVDF